MSFVCEYPSVVEGETIRVERRRGRYLSHRRAGVLNRRVAGTETELTLSEATFAYEYALVHGRANPRPVTL